MIFAFIPAFNNNCIALMTIKIFILGVFPRFNSFYLIWLNAFMIMFTSCLSGFQHSEVLICL